ncbi:MAG: RNA polymerase sigma factor [Desulfobacteraceae bacterium]|nr:RNA polymerase sigma factor [Desulfobacteraceae bacterium]
MKQPSHSFYSIFNQYHDRLKKFVAITIRNEWVADDIVQEAFFRAHSKIATLKDNDKIGSWLFSIAYRLCMDHFRKERRNSPEEIADFGGMNTSRYSTTERKLEQHQMSVCIQNQVLLLPENYRTVIWLFDVLGFTLKETADILELSLENVKIRLHRARKKLKFILSQNCSLEKDERNVLVCEPRNGVNWRKDRADSEHGLMDFAKKHIERKNK